MSLLSPVLPFAAPQLAPPAEKADPPSDRDDEFDEVFAATMGDTGKDPARAREADPASDPPPEADEPPHQPPEVSASAAADPLPTAPGADPGQQAAQAGLAGPAAPGPETAPPPAGGDRTIALASAESAPSQPVRPAAQGRGQAPETGQAKGPGDPAPRAGQDGAPRAGSALVLAARDMQATGPVPTVTAEALADPLAPAAGGEAPLSGSFADEAMLAPQSGESRRAGAGAELTGHLHRPAHHGPPPAERQIAAAILSSGSGRTEILLDPQDLGRVRLSLEGNEAGLVVTIQAERSETADLLRRNADLLMQEFREAGYADLTFTFSDRGEPADRPEPADDRPRAIAAEAVVTPPPTYPGLRGSALLDLRL